MADSASSSGTGAKGKIAVSLITKDSTNPFFVAMQDGAKEAADEARRRHHHRLRQGGRRRARARSTRSRTRSPRGQKGILITPNGPGVNDAIKKARDAGLFVIALDTPPDPADTVDITFATDNLKAGKLIGQWAAEPARRQEGRHRPARHLQRQGRLGRLQPRPGLPRGHGHRHRRPEEERRRGQDRQVHRRRRPTDRRATSRPRAPTDGGRTAWRTACPRTPTSTSSTRSTSRPRPAPTTALQGGRQDDGRASSSRSTVAAPACKLVKDGVIGATSQQYPLKMAALGVEAIVDIVNSGKKPTISRGPRLLQHRRRRWSPTSRSTASRATTPQHGSKICWG